MKSKILITLFAAAALASATNAQNTIMCTAIYMPVCAEYQVQCITAPCPPIQKTYGNKCTADAAGAKILYDGECRSNVTTSQGLISRAYDLGFTMYSSEANFRINDYVTREEAAKMTMSVIDKSGVSEWMIKLSPSSCNRIDKGKINSSLVDYVVRSCTKGLFMGYNGNFMPNGYYTDTDSMTVLNRISQYVPKLAELMTRSLYMTPKNTPITRGNFLLGLYGLYMEIKPLSDILTINTGLLNINTGGLAVIVVNETGNIMTGNIINNTSTVTGNIMTGNTGMILINTQNFTNGNATSGNIVTGNNMTGSTGMISKNVTGNIATGLMITGSYYLSSVNNIKINNPNITLSFYNNIVSAKICNSINGAYSATDNTIMFLNMVSTRKGCFDQNITNRENSFASMISVSYSYGLEGSLVITNLGETWTWSRANILK